MQKYNKSKQRDNMTPKKEHNISIIQSENEEMDEMPKNE